jgi:E3 ubiquitin-protein ligase RNF213
MSTLEAKLQIIWSTFKQTLNKNLSNFLCLNHIGLLLNYLRKESKQPEVKRLKPAYLELNVPNIIICEQSDLYSRVLEIYSLSPEQALPNDDEIMFCNETTTAEDIEIFLKRVFFKQTKDNKIYSIVNIHNLAYEQSIKVIYLYDQLTVNTKFTLALFCAQEKEDKSLLVTSFNRYYKKLTRKVDYKQIEKYLREHFINNSYLNIEKDGLSCRLIKSDRAGTGKSLYIKRLYEKMLNNDLNSKYNCITVKSKSLNIENIFNLLKEFNNKHSSSSSSSSACLFHFDIAYEVLFNVDSFLFQLLCMSVINSSNGELWRRSKKDLYLIEIMSPKIESKEIYLHSLLNIIPTITCTNPIEVFNVLQNNI